jgi:hypothetical protein
MKDRCFAEKRIESQPSWVICNKNVELAVTKLGGHMAPVTFCRDERRPVQPYHITPWQNEKIAGLPAVLTPLRGDFFCMPFGTAGAPRRGERHPLHGETAGSPWSLDACEHEGGATTLRIVLKTKARPGTVRRSFTLIDGQNVVYCRTAVEGFRGPSSYSHHAILRTTGEDRTLLISTSKFFIGATYPVASANPAEGEYQSLAMDARFRSMAKVPSIFRGQTPSDCSAFPTRRGFGDLLAVFDKPGSGRPAPSWVTAVNIAEGWMWFALKDPSVMPGRLFWIENKSRHGSPWSGRNCNLGIEDGCMYFDRVAESCGKNPINRHGIPTSHAFPGNRTVEIRYIQGAVRVPRGFDRVAKVRFSPGAAVFQSESGGTTTVPVKHDFLFNGRLEESAG